MLRSLRVRLALSHTIPVLLFVALLGTLLLYQLERTYFLDSLAAELAGQGAIIASFTRRASNLGRPRPCPIRCRAIANTHHCPDHAD